jgi:hypothetical protein
LQGWWASVNVAKLYLCDDVAQIPTVSLPLNTLRSWSPPTVLFNKVGSLPCQAVPGARGKGFSELSPAVWTQVSIGTYTPEGLAIWAN